METLSQHKRAAGETPGMQKKDISIAALNDRNWKDSVDQVALLKDLISRNEDMYPGIDGWFTKKVVPGLKSGERKAYVVFEHEKPIATAILKLGSSAKLCHLRIDEDYQDASLGQILLTQMTLDILDSANEIHFTLPETLWATKKGFFKSFGFLRAEKTSLEYRKGEAELSCSAPISKVYSAAVKKISGLLRRLSLGRFPGQSDLLMSMKADFAERVMNGSKSIEVRKRFSERWTNHEVVFYASKPTGSLVGKATVNSITRGRTEDIWSQFEGRIGCSRQEFDAYVADAGEVTAIEFKNASRYGNPMRIDEISRLLSQRLAPPQSYCGFTSQHARAWLNAIYLANLLQRTSKVKTGTKVQA
jgi:predicted transcriptional regulator/N-acetylglutamate synthase-like GNAT family acetyltransferase